MVALSLQRAQRLIQKGIRTGLWTIVHTVSIVALPTFAQTQSQSPEHGALLSSFETRSPYFSASAKSRAESVSASPSLETPAVDPYNRSVPQSATVRVFVNGTQQGTLSVLLLAGSPQQVEFLLSQLLDVLNGRLPSDISARLTQIAQARSGFLALDDLQQQGVKVTFSQEFLELHLQAGDRPRAESASAIAKGTIAARLESSGSLQVSANDSGWTLDRDPNWLSVNGRLRLAEGWELKAGGSLQEGTGVPWQRNHLQVVRTDLEHSTTYTFGEFFVSNTGYQRPIALLGLQAKSGTSSRPPAFQLDISAESTPLQSMEIHNAKDVSADSLDLPEWSDPLTVSGSSTPSSKSTAPTGEYAYAIGVLPPGPAWEDSEKLEERLVLSLSKSWNASDTLAAKTYLQGITRQQVFGTGVTWTTLAGELDWGIAASQAAVADSGFAADFQFRPNLPIPASSLNLSATYRGAKFLAVDENNPLDNSRLMLSASYAQQWFNNKIDTNLFTTYRLQDGQIPESFRVGLGISAPLTERLELTFELAQTEKYRESTAREGSLRLHLR